MSDHVLGNDPFARPAEPAPSESAPAKRPSAEPAAKPTRRPAAKPARRPAARPVPVDPPGQAPPSPPAEALIDRQELLEAADRHNSPLLRLFAAVSRALRPLTYGYKVGQMGMYWHSEEVGPFGFDPVFWARVKPFFQLMFEKYWRIELRGVENIPDSGRALLVANHSGSLPWDGIMLRLAIENAGAASRPVHFLVEDFVFHFPFLGPFVNRVGGVRACQDNATRLLAAGNLVGVFPEGVKGIGKLYRQRYQLQRFGRGGFVKLALRTDSPIVPVAVVGAEEIHPMLAKLGWLARSLKLPYVPVTPTFPWLGPLGLVPLPSKWLIRFGEPIHLERVDPEAPDAQARTMDMVERVRGSIQQMLDELVEQRKHPFFGP